MVPGDVSDVRCLGEWWVHEPVLAGWRERVRAAVAGLAERDPLAPGLSRGAALDLLDVPDPALLDIVAAEAGLAQEAGYLTLPGADRGLGAAEEAVAAIERRLARAPFNAPEGDDLTAWKLGARELAAAERIGRLLRLDGSVVLLPSAPALAMRELARLEQPFTTSQARQALDTSRRVAIPLLELLDARGWTRRVDAGHREVVR
jgi:selenocysteine-specific elongation factor